MKLRIAIWACVGALVVVFWTVCISATSSTPHGIPATLVESDLPHCTRSPSPSKFLLRTSCERCYLCACRYCRGNSTESLSTSDPQHNLIQVDQRNCLFLHELLHRGAGRRASPRCVYCEFSRLLEAQQAVEESSVASQRLAKIFGGYFAAAIPLLLEFCALIGKELCDAFHRSRDQRVRILNRFSRFVDEHALRLVPAAAQIIQFVFRKQWSMPFARGRIRLRRKSDRLVAQVREIGVAVCIRGLRSKSVSAAESSRCRPL